MAEPTSIPNLSGPIPATADSNAAFGKADKVAVFGGATSPVGLPDPTPGELLPHHDYVEEEYFVSGIVNGQPYKTSLLIRRPRDPARFSGLVALEPVHLQGALGLWQTGYPVILEGGHIWAAVGSQLGAVEGPIKTSNPERYESLQVPSTPGADEAVAELMTWSQGESKTVPAAAFAIDGVSNEILAQAGALLKAGGIAGFPAKYLILGGASQTGGATLNFIRGAHATARLPDGKPVYDGFLPMAAPGWIPVAGGDAAVMHIFAEGDLPLFGSIGPGGYVAARPDSDAINDRYRSYQIAGSSHLPTRGLRDATGIPQLGVALEPGERLTQFPSAPFYRAALLRLVDWITTGVVPPHAPPIEMSDSEIVTDEVGNAKGGLRSPYVDVATVRYVPARYVRNLIGVELPLTKETLQQLYGSRAKYLMRFDRAIDEAVKGGWILPDDGMRLKAEEAQTAPL